MNALNDIIKETKYYIIKLSDLCLGADFKQIEYFFRQIL